MEKNKLLLLPFLTGLVLIIYSWYISYPLYLHFVDDVAFNHVPILYWISLGLVLTSMCLIAITSKNNCVKWIMAVGCVIGIYSLFYFYYSLPTSDANFFRGLTEYFVATNDLDPLKPNHSYYQWPSFFILAKIVTMVSGIELATYEFLLFTIIGFILATALYVYATKTYARSGFYAVLAFFIILFFFLNYQAVPFSLSLGLLFLLFMLETRKKNSNVVLTMLILFVNIVLTHAFVPVFFILYLLFRFILSRSRQYLNLFMLSSIIYFLVQLTLAEFSLPITIKLITTFGSEYSYTISGTFAPVTIPTDVIAQMFSRLVTVMLGLICLVGFFIALIKGKMREMDKAIFLTGAFYSALGVVVYTLGTRALVLVIIPVSLGISYMFESRLRKYMKYLFMGLLVLSVFIPVHGSFGGYQVYSQTKESYQAENFMIDHYNWTNPSFVLAHVRVITYMESKISIPTNFENDVYSPLFPRLKEYDSIVYSIGLGKNLQRFNYTADGIIGEDKLNLVYNNGFSYIATKSLTFTEGPSS